MLIDDLAEILERFKPYLNSSDSDFFVIGGTSLLLQGMPGVPYNDLDLLMSPGSAGLLKTAFSAEEQKDFIPTDGDKFRSNFARFRFGGISVEVMGGLEVFHNTHWQVLEVSDYLSIPVGDHQVKTPSLQENIRILTLFGRPKDLERAGIIEQFLKTSSG